MKTSHVLAAAAVGIAAGLYAAAWLFGYTASRILEAVPR